MQPLAPPREVQHVLSFDFDGTLHDPASEPPVPAALFERLRALRASHGALWGINTGRNIEFLLDGLEDAACPFLPDWIVAREREIYQWNGGDWLPHEPWNQRCAADIDQLFEREAPLLAELRHLVLEHTGAQWMVMEGEPAGLIARTEEEMAWIVGQVEQRVGAACLLSWQRNTIYLRFGHQSYHKGSCLSEVARLHRLGAAQSFAIGDSHNDLEMLDPAHAVMTACPANALGEVQERVRSAGGWVAAASHGEGAVEALDHYFGDWAGG